MPSLKISREQAIELDLCGKNELWINSKAWSIEDFEKAKNLKIDGDLSLDRLPVKTIPEGLHVTGDLGLNESQITSLPKCKVDGSLTLSDSKKLVSLPEDLHVGNNLLIINCTALKELPKGLRVGRHLMMNGCNKIEKLPADLYVGGTIHLTSTSKILPLKMIRGHGHIEVKGQPIEKVMNRLRVQAVLECCDDLARAFRDLSSLYDDPVLNEIQPDSMQKWITRSLDEYDSLIEKSMQDWKKLL
jgi:hypothetical protein